MVPGVCCLTALKCAMRGDDSNFFNIGFAQYYMSNLELLLKNGAQFYTCPKCEKLECNNTLSDYFMNMSRWIECQSSNNLQLIPKSKERVFACFEKLKDVGCPMQWHDSVSPLSPLKVAISFHYSCMLEILLKENGNPFETYYDGTSLLEQAQLLSNQDYSFDHENFGSNSEFLISESRQCYDILKHKIDRINHANAIAALFDTLKAEKAQNLLTILPKELVNEICKYISY